MVKLKITRPEGTIIEVEGSAADINTMSTTLGLTWNFINPTYPMSPIANPGLTISPEAGGVTWYKK